MTTHPSPAFDLDLAAGSGRPATKRPVVVGIGGSAGAVTALQHFFDALPKGETGEEDENRGLSFVVVMHLAPEKRSELAEIIQAKTSLPVTQVTGPTRLEENHVYVAAPGQTLLFEGQTLVPDPLEDMEERRFPIDQFFRSLARAPVEPIGVVLSGAGSDGSVGLSALKEAGGLIAAQDPSEAQHESMPRSAIETSQVDFVLSASDLARRLSKQPQIVDLLPPLEQSEQASEGAEDLDEIVTEIFEVVRARTGHDFRQYRRSTMLRRIRRRLQVHQLHSVSEYRSYLEEHPSEAMALLKDCLISVTSFFRNPEAFEVLREKGIPAILNDRGPREQVRAWTVGCATGEEAYSLAMLLFEQAGSANVVPNQIQVFATDLDEEALAMGRRGRYPEAIAGDVPERYLNRFFQQDGDEYVVCKEIRERVLFTTHDLLADPPFSNLDLISCRNLLIYLQEGLQEKVFDVFSYALKDDGYLLLGSAESTDVAADKFQTVDKSHRLYRRRSGARSVPELPSGLQVPTVAPTNRATEDGSDEVYLDGEDGQNLSHRETVPERSMGVPSTASAHRILLENYAPPSAVVGEDYRFVYLSRDAGRYLQHPGGTPNEDIVDLVRPELRMKLRAALREAFAEEQTIRTDPTGVKFDGETRSVRLTVQPARDTFETEGLALVLFEEVEEKDAEMEASAGEGFLQEKVDGEVTGSETATDARVTRLETQLRKKEAELEKTKEELRATVHEHETSNQEMRAANEELRSMNEEYQSTAEELETSKEELQSVNEELKSVNRELEEKVKALKTAKADLESLMAATDIGTLFLDDELCIQRYTPRIEEIFNIRADDEGRPVGDLTHQLDYDHLVPDARNVLEEEASVEREAAKEGGEWFLVRHHPHRMADGRIDGVVVTFVEITHRKEIEKDLRRSNQALQERTEQVQNLIEALTSAEEEERKRLSEVLHDNLQQTLVASKMRMGSLKSNVSKEEQELVDVAIELIEEGVEITRTLSRELNPPVGKKSLREVFEWLAVQMKESYGFTVRVHAEDGAKSGNKSLQALLLRLTRELLFNAVKHAETDEASLCLEKKDDQLRVIVEDEGAGFDPATLEDEGGGHGLVSVRDRIEMIGGTLDVESAPGQGTRVTIVVPWQSNGAEEQP